MGAQASEGPYQFARCFIERGLAMEGTGLREQFGRPPHECLLLQAQVSESRPVFDAGSAFWSPATLRI